MRAKNTCRNQGARARAHPPQQLQALHERLAHKAPVRALVHGGHVRLLALHRLAQALLRLRRAQPPQRQQQRAAQRQAAALLDLGKAREVSGGIYHSLR